ncbi:SC5A6-like protein [Mya arenaria]|uniref:SC5A6-like protein n=1 Tax=Mya arenaria TaxID=6604 RepID=A0ABY7GIS4_MYAAR|nr:SC5A6-like protein [Mya arenaria]
MDKRKQNTSPEDYYLAGRKSKLLPVMFSYIVTFQSSILYLGFPAEGYIYGPMYSFYGLSKFITLLFTAFFIVPVFHPLKLTSIYEYLNLRYGDNVLRILAMTFGVVYQVFYMSTVTYGTCVALEVVMGIPYWITIVLYTSVTSVYTSIGGIKAVIWADVFQFPDMTTEFSTKISRIVTLVFGVFALLVSFLLTSLPGSVIALFQRCVACMDGPTCAIFLLSAMFKRATTKGVLLGALCGSAVALWLNLGQLYSNLPKDPPLPPGPTFFIDC